MERAQALLESGAKRVILGSALLKDGTVNVAFVEDCALRLGEERLPSPSTLVMVKWPSTDGQRRRKSIPCR